jgi:citrate lyase beta subunit
MLDSYFFIPGHKQQYLDKIDSIQADYIIIDLEDAVPLNTKIAALELVLNTTPRHNHFLRIPFSEDCYSYEQIVKLLTHFDGRIAFPKLNDEYEIIKIKNLVPNMDLSMIILVENPMCYINIKNILRSFSSQIHGIAFGSHDFCSITGIKNNLENISNFKRELSVYAKAYDVRYIDGVDLDLKEFTHFKEECKLAFEIGSEGKFLIHPQQIEELKKVNFLSENELNELKAVYDLIKTIPEPEAEILVINGKVYEKPHIKRIKFLINKLENFRNKL